MGTLEAYLLTLLTYVCNFLVVEKRWRRRTTLHWTRSAWTCCRIQSGWSIYRSWNQCEYLVIIVCALSTLLERCLH